MKDDKVYKLIEEENHNYMADYGKWKFIYVVEDRSIDETVRTGVLWHFNHNICQDSCLLYRWTLGHRTYTTMPVVIASS